MALLFFEGFDSYGTGTQLAQQANFTGNPGIVTTNVRTGRACIDLNNAFVRNSFALSGTTIVLGVGARWTAVGASQRVFRTWCSATSRSGIQVGINNSGQLTVGYGGSTNPNQDNNTAFGVTLWTGTDIEPTATYVHYELKAVLSGTATGSWTLRRNGQVVQSQSGVITLANAADVVTGLILEGRPGSNTNFDDLYVCDGSGSDNNDFLGPVRVNALAPTANDAVAWTPNTGANWDAVNDASPDDDTTYVSAASVLTDRYTIADLPASAAIVRGVRVVYRARKEDAATVETRALIRSNVTEALGPTDALDTTYRYYTAYYATDPNTGVSWTPAGVNALTAGVRRVT